MKIELNGRLITDREVLHDTLIQLLRFPQYYGRNLDALYDLLSEISEDSELLILDSDALRENLGA